MALMSLRGKDWARAQVVLDWAASPAAAEVDLGLALEVRRELRRAEPDYERVWRAACQLVVAANRARAGGAGRAPGGEGAARAAAALVAIGREPIVVAAEQLLDATWIGSQRRAR